MKRRNLLSVALFAVFAFMGTFSLSAQNDWLLPPAQAVMVLQNMVDLLHELPVPVPQSDITPDQIIDQNRKSVLGCSECTLGTVKENFLKETLLRIKQGMDTGDAVNEVRTMLTGASGGNPSMLEAIQMAYDWMVAKLG